MHSGFLDAIRGFEGFTPQASWDYAQFSNGYGTKAKFAGEVIDQAEADRRFRAEIAEARAIVEKHAPAAAEGTKAALTSLTYNAGTAWTSSGLGDAVRSGDETRMRELFLQYNKAGGEVLPGLAKRRIAEAAWIGMAGAGSTVTSSAGGSGTTAAAEDSVAARAILSATAAEQVGAPRPAAAATEPQGQVYDQAAQSQADLARLIGARDRAGVEDASSTQKVASVMAGLMGEARLTQLLLASQFLNGAQAQEGRDPSSA